MNSPSGEHLEDTEKQGRAEHSISCPANCQTCERSVEKALGLLASKQAEHGGFGEKDYKDVALTALAGLGFLASGSTPKSGTFKRELSKAGEFVTKNLSEYLAKYFENKASLKSQTSAKISMPIASVFLAHIYNTLKSDELKSMLEKVRDYLRDEQLTSGGWDYFIKGLGRDPFKEGENMVFLTTEVVIALYTMRTAGIEVDNKILEQAGKFYTTAGLQRSDGSFLYLWHENNLKIKGYEKFEQQYVTVSVGRTCASLWPMELLGLSKTETWLKAANNAEKGVENLDICPSGPGYQLYTCGISSYFCSDQSIWKKYLETFRDKFLKSQRDDGCVHIKERPDTFSPKHFKALSDTPYFAIIFQLHKKHLLFGDFKRVKSGR